MRAVFWGLSAEFEIPAIGRVVGFVGIDTLRVVPGISLIPGYDLIGLVHAD